MSKDVTYRILNAIVVVLSIAFVIYSCDTVATERKITKPVGEIFVKDTATSSDLEKKEPDFVVRYQIDSFQTKTMVDSFKSSLSAEAQNIIFALNRMDSWRLKKGKMLVVPDTLTGDLMDYSPFPRKLEILDSIPKAVLISRRVQAIALYEKGEMINWGPASTGKKSTQTPVGLYYGNYKARKKISTINDDWVMPYYFNFMNFEGIGTHKYSLPGYPASHGCVRLREQEAQIIYNWARQWELNHNEQVVERNGTPFMVFGNFDFKGTPPWLELAEDIRSNQLSSEELDTLRSYVEHYFKDVKNFATPGANEKGITLPVNNSIETLR